MAELPPGIGTPAQAMQATAFVRQQPWYQEWLTSNHIAQGPNQEVKLNDDQQLALNQLIRAHGVGMNSRYDGIDENGMIYEEHHKLKKAAIAAAIGGLALTGFGAAGIGPMAGMMGGSAALGGTTTAASMSGLGSGIGTLVPATTGLAGLGVGVGAGTAAGLGAAGAGAGLASTAIGSGFIPAITGGVGMAGGAGAGAAGAGSALAGMAGSGGAGEAAAPLASSTIGSGMVEPIAGGVGNLTGNSLPALASTQIGSGAMGPITGGTGTPGLSTVGGGGSTLSKFLNKDTLSDASSLAGAFSSGEKADRVQQGSATNQYDKNILDAQTGRNQTESDALKKLAQTSYIMGGGSQFKPPSLSLNGKNYQTADLGYGPPKITDAEKTGATNLQAQLAARLAPGGTYTPDYSKYGATPGTAEKAGSYLGTALGAAGLISNYWK